MQQRLEQAFFGSGSEEGALLYSVYGTLELWGLNYYAWTLDY